MKDSEFYKIPIAYLLPYSVLIVASGVWLFLLSQGLDSAQSLMQTLKDIFYTPEAKSVRGLIEVATPHLFAMGMLIFVAAHFMLFSTRVSKKTTAIVALMVFGFALFDILAYFMISFGWLVSGWMKLLAMVSFVSALTLLLSLLAFSL
ncbi:MAG TPA: hypothetical protein PLH07_04540 [Sulfurovum sp.]|nr:MAG: hypothetical protein B7Y63_01790 [Sulfurovum sp. 35-42-20]OYY55783.1 MAG: hypothetical protein B7Y52_04840 [Sulfurovum sp. 28-43-6]OYZ25148.1 MAG: hypothetical protein B7Y23_06825 [Sulfurovum sp. 16-42-52]OYZ50162.1 MAG: hypothetical protein B7Y13_02100 [Sulfurovum sp. 24-42-9]OZA43185.1 MAG: hypothetical protein B7X80_09555 [Sulfurovum sp. 17-42-90]OZA60071.1 MAG: hypothetical protein B7X69_05480 [Sulfurovum sp. 39-42-12]HQR73067.1 hypothetical protein [Sulfurovum sp.]